MTYDQKCYDLAFAFLSDVEDTVLHEHADALAKDIQTTIEDFLEELESGNRCRHCGYDGYFIMVHHINCPNKNKPEGSEAP